MTPLKASDLDHSHYIRLQMTASVPAGTTLEDVLTPGFWANHAYRMKRGALIEVLSEDNNLDCQLRVLETGPTFAKMRLLRNYVAEEIRSQAGSVASKNKSKTEKAAASDDEVEVNYGGKQDRWRVVHRGHVVKSGFETMVEANIAADEYRGKLAA